MAITITDLSKKYYKNNKNAIDNINAVIPNGFFGLLGENGAGKSSLLKILATVAPMQQGTIRFNEIEDYDIVEDIGEIRNMLGYLPQKFDFFEKLTVYEMLDYVGMLKGIEKRKETILDLLEEFNLSDKVNCKICRLSGGMKQRVAIAQALMGNPKYIILDEPTVGLDPTERLRFRNIISKRSDCNIIISTHIISDISLLCDNIGIMKAGKLVYCGSVDSLLEKVEGKVYVGTVEAGKGIDLEKYGKIISILRKKNLMELRFISNEDLKGKYETAIPTLEDAYFYITNLEEKSATK